MRMAKAPQEHVDTLRRWLSFNDELMRIEPLFTREWGEFKTDWLEDDRFSEIIKYMEDEEGRFSWEYYSSYYQEHISHIHARILFGYEVLVENVCDPELDYLEYRKELKELIEKNNAEQ